MLRAVKVFSRMLMWGAVAAADMPASSADPQMDPSGTEFQTFLAAERARGHVADTGKMRAGIHESFLIMTWACRVAPPDKYAEWQPLERLRQLRKQPV